MPEEIQGLAKALRSFKRMKEAGQLNSMRSALNTAGTPLVRDLRIAAPVGTEPHITYLRRTVTPGFLSRGIKKSTRIFRQAKTVVLTVKPTAEAWYGKFKEYGGTLKNKFTGTTYQYEKEPWFFKTVERGEPEVRRAYFDKLIDRIGKAFRG